MFYGLYIYHPASRRLVLFDSADNLETALRIQQARIEGSGARESGGAFGLVGVKVGAILPYSIKIDLPGDIFE